MTNSHSLFGNCSRYQNNYWNILFFYWNI